MKFHFWIISATILLISICQSTSLLGQSLKTFPTNCEPKEISSEQAESQAKDLLESCGFGSAFIDRVDLEDLLKVEKCVGIRFYISMESDNQKYVDVTAVAINESGEEIGNTFQRSYLMVKSLDEYPPKYARGLNYYEAERCVNNLAAAKSSLTPYVGYLGSEGLNNLLKTDCDGIRIYPSDVELDGKVYHSMAFGSVKIDGEEMVNTSDTYLQAMHPCPTDCGGDGDKNYLWNSKD